MDHHMAAFHWQAARYIKRYYNLKQCWCRTKDCKSLILDGILLCQNNAQHTQESHTAEQNWILILCKKGSEILAWEEWLRVGKQKWKGTLQWISCNKRRINFGPKCKADLFATLEEETRFFIVPNWLSRCPMGVGPVPCAAIASKLWKIVKMCFFLRGNAKLV